MSLWHHTKQLSLHVTKKTGRILFPYLWHFLTDDYKGRLHHLIVDSILSLIILGLVGANIVLGEWFYLFSIEPTVDVTVAVPEVIISGEPLKTNITLTPTNKAITDVRLKAVVPAGYEVTAEQQWEWPHLEAGDTQTLTLAGRFSGDFDKTYRVIALYDYHYFGQTFSDYVTVEFTVDTSSFELVTSVPPQILNQESFNWTVEYYNSAAKPRRDVCLEFDLPEAFVLDDSSVPITADWRAVLPEVGARQGGVITLTGSFRKAIGEGSQVMQVTALDDCSKKKVYQQVVLTTPIEVLTPRLQLQTSGASVLNVGDVGSYVVKYSNTGDAVLSTVKLTAHFNSDPASYGTIAISGSGRRNGSTISWQNSNLAPGETRTQTFTVASYPLLRQKNVAFSYTVSASADIADLGVTTYAAPISGLTTKFNSTLQFSQVARYTGSSGEQLGYGPYPLQAWEVTALRVFWQVEDFTNDLNNVTITATLPSQVEWTGHSAVTAGGAMSYDPTTRRVTWHTSNIPSFSYPQGASFEVRVLPNSAQVGKRIHLTNDTIFTARDSFTGTVLTRAAGALLTDQPIQAAIQPTTE